MQYIVIMEETTRRRRTVTSSLHGISTGKRKEGAGEGRRYY
jgi:hypothetical protein